MADDSRRRYDMELADGNKVPWPGSFIERISASPFPSVHGWIKFEVALSRVEGRPRPRPTNTASRHNCGDAESAFQAPPWAHRMNQHDSWRAEEQKPIGGFR
jgi:hypothetical protein